MDGLTAVARMTMPSIGHELADAGWRRPGGSSDALAWRRRLEEHLVAPQELWWVSACGRCPFPWPLRVTGGGATSRSGGSRQPNVVVVCVCVCGGGGGQTHTRTHTGPTHIHTRMDQRRRAAGKLARHQTERAAARCNGTLLCGVALQDFAVLDENVKDGLLLLLGVGVGGRRDLVDSGGEHVRVPACVFRDGVRKVGVVLCRAAGCSTAIIVRRAARGSCGAGHVCRAAGRLQAASAAAEEPRPTARSSCGGLQKSGGGGGGTVPLAHHRRQ